LFQRYGYNSHWGFSLPSPIDLFIRDYHDLPYEVRVHFIYEKYHWTPDIVDNLPIDEVNNLYTFLIEVLKVDREREYEIRANSLKYIAELFKNLAKSRRW